MTTPTRPALAALADPAVLPDPYPVLAGLREASPFAQAGGALVVVGRHADCSAILRDLIEERRAKLVLLSLRERTRDLCGALPGPKDLSTRSLKGYGGP